MKVQSSCKRLAQVSMLHVDTSEATTVAHFISTVIAIYEEMHEAESTFHGIFTFSCVLLIIIIGV